MGRSVQTAKVIDGILLAAIGTGTIAAGLVLPGSTIALAPLASAYAKGYDKRQKQREYQRLLMYMKRQGLLETGPREGNGLVLTAKGRKRAQKAQIDSLVIEVPAVWDNRWRIVLFDIPEQLKVQRDYFTDRLRRLGMYQLQKSIWIHPFPCETVVEIVAIQLKIDTYITYIEADKIAHEKELKHQFPSLKVK
ncbi:hypothetical protein EYC59_00265 [Candidatus Saccharibacteria bacterium]|nr:MAG: hypothetical protein EYC59_00265 [Candidatus Saccharibacteria bacterium]